LGSSQDHSESEYYPENNLENCQEIDDEDRQHLEELERQREQALMDYYRDPTYTLEGTQEEQYLSDEEREYYGALADSHQEDTLAPT